MSYVLERTPESWFFLILYIVCCFKRGFKFRNLIIWEDKWMNNEKSLSQLSYCLQQNSSVLKIPFLFYSVTFQWKRLLHLKHFNFILFLYKLNAVEFIWRKRFCQKFYFHIKVFFKFFFKIFFLHMYKPKPVSAECNSFVITLFSKKKNFLMKFKYRKVRGKVRWNFYLIMFLSTPLYLILIKSIYCIFLL